MLQFIVFIMIIIIILLIYYYTLLFLDPNKIQLYHNRYNFSQKKQIEKCKNELLQKHGNLIVQLSIFNTLRQTKDLATYPIKNEYHPLHILFKKQSLYQYEYKNRLDPDDNNPLHKTILSYIESLDILSRLQKYTDDITIKIRICSGNWKFNSHFDCIYNFVFMLYGTKRFLFYSLDSLSISEQKQFISKIFYKKQNEIIDILQKNNIKSKLIILKPGDMLYIPKGLYHMVEADEPSILINFIPELNTTLQKIICSYRFQTLWNRQSNNCITKQCLYSNNKP